MGVPANWGLRQLKRCYSKIFEACRNEKRWAALDGEPRAMFHEAQELPQPEPTTLAA